MPITMNNGIRDWLKVLDGDKSFAAALLLDRLRQNSLVLDIVSFTDRPWG